MACFDVVGDIQLTADGCGVVMASGPNALAQRLRNGLQTPLGTWRWDRSVGIPLTGIEKLTLPIVKAVLRRFFLSFSDVARVLSLTVSQDGGLAIVTYRLLVTAGETLEDSVPFTVVNR